MTTVISVENLSKNYRLGTIGNHTLYEDLNRWWARRRGKPDPALKIGETDYGNREGEYIWALRDISFQVREGEVLGIIGRNGAGKSTLLKILSRVTAPTSGNIKIKGRIASLLEVGTGFHPELTGRENIYLNGAILGMSRTEIDRKLDEIIDFSGVEKFIATPVKRYSSGMYVRLAFAVAAHLEPEILVVDEVLAVGDVEFQKKCLGKMGSVAGEGRTVLFVSHNMTSIQHLCKRGVLLSEGQIVYSGDIEHTIMTYLQSFRAENSGSEVILDSHPGRRAGRPAIIKKAQLLVDDQKTNDLKVGDSLQIKMWLDSDRDLNDHYVILIVENSLTQRILNVSTKYVVENPMLDVGSKICVTCTIPNLLLLPDTYYISMFVSNDKYPGDAIDQAMSFTMHQHDVFGSGSIPPRGKAIIFSDSHWNVESDKNH